MDPATSCQDLIKEYTENQTSRKRERPEKIRKGLGDLWVWGLPFGSRECREKVSWRLHGAS